MVRFIKSHHEFAYVAGDLAELSEEHESKLISSGHAVAETTEEEAEETSPDEEVPPVPPDEEVPPVPPDEEAVKESVKPNKK